MSSFPKDEFIKLNGLRFHYRDWGGAGQAVVLAHGLASTCHIWDLVAPILSKDFRVLALDQRGHGESDKPDCGYDFATVAGDLLRFVEAMGLERPIIVGHSWGGSVALELAVACPGVARGLCFVDGGTIEISARPGMTLQRAREEMAPPDFTGVTVEQFRQRIRGRFQGEWVTPQVEDIVLACFEVLADNTIRARLSRRNHLQVIEALWAHKPSQLYPRVRCPVLLMPARQSGNESAMDRRLRREEAIAVASRLLPVSATVWLEESIHDVPLQRPALVAEVIRRHFQQGFFQ